MLSQRCLVLGLLLDACMGGCSGGCSNGRIGRAEPAPLPESEPESEPAPTQVAHPRIAPELALGVDDRGIFSDLDARVQLALPTPLEPGRVNAVHDGPRGLLVVYDGAWPIKVYPAAAGAAARLELGGLRLGLRAGDHAELAPWLEPSRVRPLEPGSAPPPGDADGDGIPDPLDTLIGARKAALNADRYDGRYERIAYPLGDVPRDIGVCTDVVIRALRNAGLDLQRAVHEDILGAPQAYPGVTRPNPNIDHRRVKTLIPYFQRHFEPHSPTPTAEDPYRPGDIVFMDTFPDRTGVEHVGIVSDRPSAAGDPLVINNWTDGSVTTDMDLLPHIPVTHRFRMPPRVVETSPIPPRATQLVLALSSGFDDWHAHVQRYERKPGEPFRRVGDPLPAVLGGSGYGWGNGLHGSGAPRGRPGPIKHEGDRRSPAGAFNLGTLHGYATTAGTFRLPYLRASADQRCVDDPASTYYNQIVSITRTGEPWSSAEHMRRDDALYEFALDIDHNRSPVRAGDGSCIFVHVWSDANTPVTGCTALAREDLRGLLEWLRPGAAVWIALPEAEHRALRVEWGLP